MPFMKNHYSFVLFLFIFCSFKLFSQTYPFVPAKDSILSYNYIEKANYYTGLMYYDSSIYYYKNALSCDFVSSDIKVLQNIYYRLCITYLNILEYDSSLYYAKKSNTVLKESITKDYNWKIIQCEKVSYILGHINYINNEFDISLKHYNNGIKYIDTISKIDTSFNNTFNLSWYYANIGAVYSELGHYDKSIENFNKSIDLQQTLKNDSEIYCAYNYLSIADILIYKGDYYLALIYYQHVLNIYVSCFGRNSPLVGIVYNNIGLMYFNKNEYSKSLNYFNKAMDIALGKTGVTNEVLANIYNNLGDVYRKLKKYKLANTYFIKVLTIYDTLYDNTSLEIAFIYNNIANLYKDRGNYNRAIDYYNKSIVIRKKILGEKHDKIAQIYQNLGIIYVYKQEYTAALKLFQKAIIANTYEFDNLNIYSNPENPSSVISKIELLETLIYKSETILKRYTGCVSNCDSILMHAIQTYDLAIKISDYIRLEYQAEQSRLLLNSKTQQIYLLALKYLTTNGRNPFYIQKSHEYIERSKNYHLLTQLSDLRAKRVGGVPRSIIDKEKELKSLIEIYQLKLYQADASDTVSITRYKRKIFHLSKEFEAVLSNLEKDYPKYFGLKYDFKIPIIKKFQEELKDNQALINYYYDDQYINTCVITKDSFMLIKDTLEESFVNNINKYIKSINLINIRESYEYAHSLYCTLLGPIQNYIKHKEELIIIPCGVLYYLPFEALITKPVINLDTPKASYLIHNYNIKYHYSATLWLNSVKEATVDFLNNNYKYEFIGFAPVFLNNDVKYNYLKRLNLNDDVLRYSEKHYTLDPLPYSGEEVVSISNMFNNHGARTKLFLMNAATEENFKINVSNAKFVHLATHGFINHLNPSLSGLIFYDHYNDTTENTNSNNQAVSIANDGILYLNELYNLNINADLVILSACESGSGKLEKTEGVMSMTRGLLYSGVKNIVISLFKVPDKQTKNLMFEFYQNIISGSSYSEALRMAKIKLINSNNSFPKFWSSFVLIGI